MDGFGGTAARVCVAAAIALGVVSTSVQAAVNTGAARNLCRSQGGTFSADADFYRCVFLDGTAPTIPERRAARRVCVERYRGTFEFSPAGAYTDPAYGCALP